MAYLRLIFYCVGLLLWCTVRSGTLEKRDFPVSQDYSHSEQNNPAVAIGLDGKFAIVLVDYRFGNGDVFCRLYDSGAIEIGNDFTVNDDGTGAWHLEPALSSDWNGNYCAVWKDCRNSLYPFDPDIYYQRLDSGGFVGVNRVITVEMHDAGHQSPAIAAAGWGRTVAAWVDLRNRNRDVYVQSFDADGNPVGLTRLVNDNDSSTPQHEPDVPLSSTGWFVFVWHDRRNGNSPDNPDVRFQRFDSVHFTALMEAGSPSPQTIIVNNSGGNGINFNLAPTIDWLTLDKTSGSDGEAVPVGRAVSSLAAGDYRGFITASGSGDLNSPESISVTLSLQADRPNMAAVPKQVELNLLKGETVDDSLRVMNLNVGALNWRAECDASWLTLQSDSGQENELIRYAIETAALDAGTYLDSVVITDDMAFSNPLTVPIRVAVSVTDTVVIIPVQVETGTGGQAPLFFHNHNRFRSGIFRVHYDKSMLTVDSIDVAPGGMPVDSLMTEIDRVAGMFTVTVSADSGLAVEPGYYHLGDVFITADDSNTGTACWNASEDTLHFYLETDAGARMTPLFNGGEITISESTDVADAQTGTIPSVFFLGQNSPNPFNGGTTITYGLRRSGPVRVEVYNILGQVVAVIVDDYLSAGVHSTGWDGKDSRRREMASGIYFYRMSTPGFISVRKMIFLK